MSEMTLPKITRFFILSFLLTSAVPALAETGKVYFITPKNNDTVEGEFTVKFGLKGMQVKPAGELVKGTGHHHLLIDDAPIEKGQVVINDNMHLHFGKGQTETKVSLPPGKHTLTMQFADGAHLSYGSKMSATITVNVKGHE